MVTGNYTVYGIPNCNSVQKARAWLEEQGIPYEFHDYKKKGITKTKLTAWCKELGWENVINKKGTTWRDLDEATKASVNSQARAVQIMMEHNSIIKRPIIEKDGKFIVMRFDEEQYRQIFL